LFVGKYAAHGNDTQTNQLIFIIHLITSNHISQVGATTGHANLRDLSGIAPSEDYAHLENWTIDVYNDGSCVTNVYQSKNDENLWFRTDFNAAQSAFTASDSFNGDLLAVFNNLSQISKEYSDLEEAPAWDNDKSLINNQIGTAQQCIKQTELQSLPKDQKKFQQDLPNAVIDTRIEDETGSIISQFWSKSVPFPSIKVEEMDGQTIVTSDWVGLDNVFDHLESIWHDDQLAQLRDDMPRVTITDHLQRAERKFARDQRKAELRKQVKGEYSRLMDLQRTGYPLEEPTGHQALQDLIEARTGTSASLGHRRRVFHAITQIASEAEIEDVDMMVPIITALFNKFVLQGSRR